MSPISQHSSQMVIKIIASLIALGVFEASAQQAELTTTDDVTSKNLNEVIVSANRGWIDGEKVIFIPNRNEKNTSNSPQELIDAMNLPVVKKMGDEVVSLSGQPITYFINGVPVDKIDAAAFWAKYAKRVEYMESPSDPAFLGAKAAINIIMTEFSAGGITKFEAYQKFPNLGSYTTSTIVSYRRMSFGALFEGEYYRDHQKHSEESELIRDIYYNGNFYNETSRIDRENSWERTNSSAFILNARYRDSRFRATHTFSYIWNRDPGSGSSSTGEWNPDIFNNPDQKSLLSSNSNTYSLKGEYFGNTSNKKWTFAGNWAYTYGRINQDNSSYTALLNPISNTTKEDSHSLTADFIVQYRPNPKFYLILFNNNQTQWHFTDYLGSQSTRLRQYSNTLKSSLRLLWIPTKNFQTFIEPGLVCSSWRSGLAEGENKTVPTVSFNATYSPSRKWLISESVKYYNYRPSLNETADITLRESELMWVKGNPTLQNVYNWNTTTSATWMPHEKFNISAVVMYDITRHKSFALYSPAQQSQEGLIRTFTDLGDEHSFRFDANFNWSLLNRNLTLSFIPEFRRSSYSFTNKQLNYLTFYARGNYRFGDFRSEIWWEAPGKILSSGGLETITQRGALNASITYGLGDWYFSLRANDIFNKYHHRTRRYDSEFYSIWQDRYLKGRSLSITISYSFGYGLKIKDDLNISTGNAASSAVVGKTAE